MSDEESSERWDGYFYLFLGQDKCPKDAAELADDALMEWRLRYDASYSDLKPAPVRFVLPEEVPDLPGDRNPGSSLPPNGSVFYTKKLQDEPQVTSGCCDAPIEQDPSGVYDNFPICSKCKKPAGV